MRALALVCCALLLVAACPVGAQENQPSGAASAEQRFNELFAQWKALLTRLRAIQLEYKNAPPAERKPLEDEFKEKVAQAEALAPELRASVEAAYVANPANREAADFLGGLAYEANENQEHAEALRLAKLLIDHQYNNEFIYELAGSAAFHLYQFDDAKQWLQLAHDKKRLSPSGESLLQSIDQEKAHWEAELALRAAEDKPDNDPKALPRVELKTTKGTIVIELFEDQAPNTVAHFLHLVESGFYKDKPFHRVLKDAGNGIAQGGALNDDGSGDMGYTIPCEVGDESKYPNFRRHFPGSVSMAHAGKDTGCAQFFICLRRRADLDNKHTVFGRVIQGMDVAANLQQRDPRRSGQPAPDRILEAKVLRKRDHEYKFVKVGESPTEKPQERSGNNGSAPPQEGGAPSGSQGAAEGSQP